MMLNINCNLNKDLDMRYIKVYEVVRYVNWRNKVQWNVKRKGQIFGSYSYFFTRKEAVRECERLNDAFNSLK